MDFLGCLRDPGVQTSFKLSYGPQLHRILASPHFR